MSQFIPLKPRQNSAFTQRLFYFLYFFYMVLLLILGRFFYLQVLRSDYYAFLAEGNTEQKYPLIPPRGLIYDRNGFLLAKNQATYNLSLIPAYLPRNREKRLELLKTISRQFDIPYNFLIDKLQYQLRSYHPLLIKENLTKKQLIYLEEYKSLFPFLNIIEYSGRIYPLGEATSHLLGYIGIINQQELKKLKDKGYRRDSIIGKTGIEQEYDFILRGIEGENVKIVNSLGKPVRDLPEKNIPSVPGKNVVLSIDSSLQDLIYSILYGRKGVIIVTRPSNGEVIALASSPGFDANQFINPETRQSIFAQLIRNPDKPFLNRAIQGRYPVGSIFKVVVALAGLEDEKIDPYEKINCNGTFKLGDQVFKDLKKHGPVDMFSALEHSCNVYFYTLGYHLGYASILEHAWKIGLSSITHLDIPGEIPGFLPTPEWKEKQFKEPWYDGDTVNASIGQGFILLTPITANNIISVIAAGKVYQPRILWKVKNPYTNIVEKEYRPKLLTSFQPSKKTLEAIREGLKRVPLTGTGAYHKWLSNVPIAGKTGSAENYQSKTHSWYISYGPLNKPQDQQYAITVMVETAGHGGSIAVPVASVIYNFLEGKMDREKALKTIYQIFQYQENK